MWNLLIENRPIGEGSPCFIAAEISCNHAGIYGNADHLVRVAARAGADAVKFQLFKPEDITLDSSDPSFQLTSGPWKGRKLYDLYEEAQTPREWFPSLFATARQLGLVPFSTIQTPDDIDFLESLHCPLYKIASAEITYLELIEAVLCTRKPVVISTGMASWREIEDVMDMVTDESVILLHCVSAYPTRVRDANLRHLIELQEEYPTELVGLSDHSMGSIVPVMSVALGARMIEKHIRLASVPSLDEDFSLTFLEFKDMVEDVRAAEAAMRPPVEDVELDSRQFRRRNVNGRWVRANT